MKIKKRDLMKIIQEACGDIPLDQKEDSIEIDLSNNINSTGRDLDYSYPSEGNHAKKHLSQTSKDALELHDILLDDDNIPTWCLEYLALARHGVSVVKDYLSYKINKKEK